MTTLIPAESTEQKLLVQWLRMKGIAHFRVPNETYTKSFKQKANNKALGVVPGVPDLFVVLPGTGILAIELKRIKKSVTSDAQKQWIETLNKVPGCEARICYGYEDAVKFISEFLPAGSDDGLPF